MTPFGDWETPDLQLGQRVTHRPSGKSCLVMGFRGWSKPMMLYALDEDMGETIAEWIPRSDIEVSL